MGFFDKFRQNDEDEEYLEDNWQDDWQEDEQQNSDDSMNVVARPAAQTAPSPVMPYDARTHSDAQSASQVTLTPTLPAYIMNIASYDELETLVGRVRTGQPVALSLVHTDNALAHRVLDFCLGFACGVRGCVEELAHRVYVVIPQGVRLTQIDKDRILQNPQLMK